jgi:hypothetical protein
MSMFAPGGGIASKSRESRATVTLPSEQRLVSQQLPEHRTQDLELTKAWCGQSRRDPVHLR